MPLVVAAGPADRDQHRRAPARGDPADRRSLLPLVLVAVVAAIELASSGVALEPTAAPVVALVILAAGAAFGALGTLVDARARREARRAEHDRLALLTGRGYVAGRGAAGARAAAPARRVEAPAAAPAGLDDLAARRGGLHRRPRREAPARGGRRPLAVARRGRGARRDRPVRPARGRIDRRPRAAPPRPSSASTPCAPAPRPPAAPRRLAANGDGLFDVTDLVGVAARAGPGRASRSPGTLRFSRASAFSISSFISLLRAWKKAPKEPAREATTVIAQRSKTSSRILPRSVVRVGDRGAGQELRGREEERVQEAVDFGAVRVVLGEVDEQGADHREDGGRAEDDEDAAAQVVVGLARPAGDRHHLVPRVFDRPVSRHRAGSIEWYTDVMGDADGVEGLAAYAARTA